MPRPEHCRIDPAGFSVDTATRMPPAWALSRLSGWKTGWDRSQKPTVPIGIIGVIACGLPKLLIGDKTWFFILGAIIGVFFEPA